MEDSKTINIEKSYYRMLQQEKFVEAICKLCEDQAIDIDLYKEVNEKYGKLELSTFENFQESISKNDSCFEKALSIIENRFAYSVKRVIDYDEGQIINLKEVFYDLGIEKEVDYVGLPIRVVYDAIRDSLLDGGKSEELNRIMFESDDEIVWTRVRPTTMKYWTYLDIDFKSYYIPLRRSFIYGMLEQTDIEFKALDDTVFSIAKRK